MAEARIGRPASTAEDSTRRTAGTSAVRAPARLGRPPAEDSRIDLDAVVGPYLSVAVLALAIVSLLLLLLVFWVWSRTRRLGRRLDSLTRGQDDEFVA